MTVVNSESVALLEANDNGLYCEAGGVYVDPWGPADRAIITHAHADRARPVARRYLCARPGAELLRARLPGAEIEAADYGETVALDGVRVSLHPAGHILGSAQVRIERGGEVWVVSGDYKLEPDPTCAPFEPVRCHTFVTESTFGLPIFRWAPEREIFAGINAWWRANRERGKASVLFGCAIGRAQRVLAGVDPAIGPIHTHASVENVNARYRAAGVSLPETSPAPKSAAGALIVAPPFAQASPWMRRFGSAPTAVASGWMRIRGTRRRRAVDRGFVLSDHADWPALLSAIEATGAERVLVTHGYASALAHWLLDSGVEARAVATPFEGERDDGEESA